MDGFSTMTDKGFPFGTCFIEGFFPCDFGSLIDLTWFEYPFLFEVSCDLSSEEKLSALEDWQLKVISHRNFSPAKNTAF